MFNRELGKCKQVETIHVEQTWSILLSRKYFFDRNNLVYLNRNIAIHFLVPAWSAQKPAKILNLVGLQNINIWILGVDDHALISGSWIATSLPLLKQVVSQGFGQHERINSVRKSVISEQCFPNDFDHFGDPPTSCCSNSSQSVSAYLLRILSPLST